MEVDEPLDPRAVGLFGAAAVVAGPKGLAELTEGRGPCAAGASDTPPSDSLRVSCACRRCFPPTVPIQPPGTQPYRRPEVYSMNSAFANTFSLPLLHQASTGRIDQ